MAKKPNVLWIFSDEHRASAMSCSGDPNIETQNIDRLASEGIRFIRAYSNCPLCAPFRASLMTGKYINNHGVNSLHVPLISQPMLAETMQQLGYHTSYMGKWHLCGGEAPSHFVSQYFRPGWDEWLGWENSNRLFNTEYSTDSEYVFPIRLKGYQTDGLTDLATEWIEKYDGEKPWFTVISYEAPHPPTAKPENYVGEYAPKEYLDQFFGKELMLRDNVPAGHIRIDEFKTKLKCYYAAIKNLDDNIGRLIESLEKTGQLDNTIIFYFSDHGDFMGSHGKMHKQRPEEESSGIPLIIRYPEKIKPGTVCDSLIGCVDFMPTMLGMLDACVPSYVEGMDLSHVVFGETGRERKDVLIQYDKIWSKLVPEDRFRALVTKRYKYAHFMVDGPCQLFDLEKDPFEMNNLVNSDDYKDIKKLLHGQLIEMLKSIGDNYADIM